MRKTMWMMIVCAASVAACGSDGGGTGGAGGMGAGGSGTSSSSSSSSSASSSSSSTSSSSSSSGAATTINGCDPSTAEDHTSENPMMLMFGGSLGDTYSPKCAKIKKGAGVMFMGNLATHPLAGGVNGQIDPNSPIKETKTGTEITFDNLPAGAYGYFCETHDASGMNGAIFVE